MGQIILYNVTFLRRPKEPVLISIFYRQQDTATIVPVGKYLADQDGKFTPAVVLNVKDNTWYTVTAGVDCGPCLFEKLMFPTSDTTPRNPCCAPEIIAAYVATATKPLITWQGSNPVCLKDPVTGYNTGTKRFLIRNRIVDGVADGYSEPNTAGPDFVSDLVDHSLCPLPVISWAGINPFCIKDALGYNTGLRGYQNRARMVSGVPDGYTEENVQDQNYVAPENDLANCPLPAYTWKGSNPYCIKDASGINSGMVGYATRDRMVNGVPDGYSENNTPGTNYVIPIYEPGQCPVPLITWQGDAPVCLKDINGFNSGMARYSIRRRLQDGVLDGYTEPNDPGPNFVPDYLAEDICPIPAITWIGVQQTGYCVLDDNGQNTGMFAYADRARVVNGVEDGYIEENEPDSNFVPPVQDFVTCPLPVTTTVPGTTTTVPPTTTLPVITWQGSGPYCQQQPVCQPGFVLSPDGSTCTKEETQAPTVTATDYCLAFAGTTEYAPYFSRIYNPGFANSSILLYAAPVAQVFAEMSLQPQWKNPGNATGGPANRSAVWIDSNCDGVKDTLAVGAKTTISFQHTNSGAERTVYVGVFGDNLFELKVNENTIATSPSGGDMQFRLFHIFPVTLAAGTNYFNLVGTGDGFSYDAIGMIVYDNTAQEIRDAVSDASLHILFNSAFLIGQHIQVATCPTGWILDTSNPTAYVCKKITREDSTLVNSTIKLYANRDRFVNGVADGYSEPNTAGPNYVPGVTDTGMCPGPVAP